MGESSLSGGGGNITPTAVVRYIHCVNIPLLPQDRFMENDDIRAPTLHQNI